MFLVVTDHHTDDKWNILGENELQKGTNIHPCTITCSCLPRTYFRTHLLTLIHIHLRIYVVGQASLSLSSVSKTATPLLVLSMHHLASWISPLPVTLLLLLLLLLLLVASFCPCLPFFVSNSVPQVFKLRSTKFSRHFQSRIWPVYGPR